MARSPAKKLGKRGPRPRGPYEHKRKTLTTRITEDTRKRLEQEADARGRSLSQEIELRLDRSFTDYDARLQGFGTEERLTILRAVALALEMVEISTGKKALTDSETASSAFDAMVGILDVLLSARPGPLLDKVTPTEGQKMILKDATARSSGQNIRDVVLEHLLPQLPAVKAAFDKKRRQ